MFKNAIYGEYFYLGRKRNDFHKKRKGKNLEAVVIIQKKRHGFGKGEDILFIYYIISSIPCH